MLIHGADFRNLIANISESINRWMIRKIAKSDDGYFENNSCTNRPLFCVLLVSPKSRENRCDDRKHVQLETLEQQHLRAISPPFKTLIHFYHGLDK